MSTAGMLARLDAAEVGLRRLTKAIGFASGAIRRSSKPGIDGALYLAVAEVELRRAREMSVEVMAAVDLATATPEPRS